MLLRTCIVAIHDFEGSQIIPADKDMMTMFLVLYFSCPEWSGMRF